MIIHSTQYSSNKKCRIAQGYCGVSADVGNCDDDDDEQQQQQHGALFSLCTPSRPAVHVFYIMSPKKDNVFLTS